MLKQNHEADVRFTTSVTANKGAEAKLAVGNRYVLRCFDKHGNFKWGEDIHNLVTNEGLDDILDKYLKGSSYTAAWYLGLTDGTPTIAAGDTLASHAGWTEVTAYTGDRQAVTFGTVSSQSVDNSGAVNAFAITGTATIGGAFLASAATGTSGVLYSAAAFSGDRVLENGDTLNVTVTSTAASA